MTNSLIFEKAKLWKGFKRKLRSYSFGQIRIHHE